MTLTEYLTQDPIKRRSPASVILQIGEYQFFIRGFDWGIRIYEIDRTVYIVKPDSNTLWTMDENGNPLNRSVFALEVHPSEMIK